MFCKPVSGFLLAVAAGTLFSGAALAVDETDLYGTWCLPESTQGKGIRDAVELEFTNAPAYRWQEGDFEQSGRWSLDGNVINLSANGRYKVVEYQPRQLVLEKIRSLSFQRGGC